MSFDSAILHVCAVGARGHHGGHTVHVRRPGGVFYTGPDIVEVVECPSVGAIERRNPLPAARYWVDVFAPDAEAFGAWLSSNAATVHVRTTEHFDAIDGAPSRDWVLFDVNAPTPWSGPGLPTIAQAGVTSSSDTATRPDPPPSLATELEQGAHSILAGGAFVKGMLGVVAGAVAIHFALELARKGAA